MMRKRPHVPVATPDSRLPRAEVPLNGIRVSIAPVPAGARVHGWARALGMGGLFVECKLPLPDDTEVRIEMLTRVGQTPHRLKLLGWVVYWDGHGMGIQFDDASLEQYPQFGDIVSHYLTLHPPNGGRPGVSAPAP